MPSILTEIWSPRPEWLALSADQRRAFFDDRVNPFLGSMLDAEILACAINDNTGPDRLDHTYVAVWKLPDKPFSDRLEAGATALGFLDDFEQVNVSGTAIPPPALNDHIIAAT